MATQLQSVNTDTLVPIAVLINSVQLSPATSASVTQAATAAITAVAASRQPTAASSQVRPPVFHSIAFDAADSEESSSDELEVSSSTEGASRGFVVLSLEDGVPSTTSKPS